MYYLCTSEEERALNKRVFSSFFEQKKWFFTSDVEKSTLLRKIFLGVCGNFFSNVGLRGRDSEVFLGVEIIKEVKVFSPKKL